MREVLTTLAAGLGIAALLYAAIVAVFFVYQRAMQYPAPRGYVAPAEAGLEGVEAVSLPVGDGAEVAVWWVPPPHGDAPVALYFHGNAERLADLAERIEVLRADGFGVAAMAYRGYPGSTGRPTEANLVADAGRLHGWVTEKGVAPERIVAIGFSLGTAVATALAAERPVGALVLYAPFTSAADVASHVYPWLPVRLLMRDQMRSDERIRRVAAPVAIVHGTADRIVRYPFGRRLFEAAPEPKIFVTLEGADHFLPADAGRGEVLPFLARHMAPAVAFPVAERLLAETDAAAGEDGR